MSIDSDYGNVINCDEAQYRDLPIDRFNDHDTTSNQGDADSDIFLDFPPTQYSAEGMEATATRDASDFDITSGRHQMVVPTRRISSTPPVSSRDLPLKTRRSSTGSSDLVFTTRRA